MEEYIGIFRIRDVKPLLTSPKGRKRDRMWRYQVRMQNQQRPACSNIVMSRKGTDNGNQNRKRDIKKTI
ncbi:hypothetical protein [Xylanibacter muris]|uniref:Uncharacterized protein n=1 Tax=Xylanibacter muris TaxID=2736290 RepID=A0ABX2APZ2_9BACT|nr:hypothetical protein [Xylanibacter muris]NPD93054.1 hypothetical protein [Xylanibacter muris]